MDPVTGKYTDLESSTNLYSNRKTETDMRKETMMTKNSSLKQRPGPWSAKPVFTLPKIQPVLGYLRTVPNTLYCRVSDTNIFGLP